MKKLLILIGFVVLTAHISAQLNIKHYIGAGRYAIFKKDYTEAINRFSRIIEVKPKYAEAYFLRGIAKYNLGDYLGAREDFSSAIAVNPFYAESYHYRGLAKEQLNDFNDALNDFEQALQMDPTESLVYVHRGLTYLMNDKFTLARNDFNEALRLDPNQPLAYMNRAIAFLELKDTVKAIKDLNKSIQLNPYNSESFRRRGLIAYLKENYEQAIIDYNMALRLEPKNSLIVYQRALAKYKKGNYDGALEDYNTVITLDPDNALAYYNRALLKSETGNYNEAIKDYDRVSELNPDNVLVYYNRAGVKIEIGELNGALKDYDKAIEIFPDFATAYINRSIVKNKLGKEKSAYVDRRRAEAIIAEYKKSHDDTTYQAFKDTTRNLSQLVDFNSEFNNDFSRNRLQNTNVQITLKNNYVLIPTSDRLNLENVIFIAALFEKEKQNSESWKWTPTLWQNDTSELVVSPLKIDSIPPNANQYDLYNYIIYQSLNNNYHKAIKPLEAASKTWEDYFILGTIKAKMEDYIQTMNKFPTQIKLQEDAGSINSSTASGQNADYTDAIMDLTRSIDINNTFSLAYYNRGNLYCQQRNFKKGIADYTKSIEIDQLPESYFNRGLTLIYLKETERGCLDVSKAGELGIPEAYNVIKRYCIKETQD